MDDKKKKQYIIFISIAFVLIVAIYLMPSPGKGKSVPYVPPGNGAAKASIAKQLETINQYEDMSESSSGISGRRVGRDVFRNPFAVQETQVQNSQPQPAAVQQQKVQKEFKITGILMTGEKKSFVLSDGRIVSENESVDGYKVIKIGRGEVIFMSKADKTVMQVKVWEDKK